MLPVFIASPSLCLQGTVLCDVILLNFLKGAEQYKAKKFEEVIKLFSCTGWPTLSRTVSSGGLHLTV